MHNPISLRMEVLGLKRSQNSIVDLHGEDLVAIPNTQYCEDMHFHRQSNMLFAASEPNTENRWKWFPPMDNFHDPTAVGQGTIVVIDAKTFAPQRLTLTNFKEPFITHGIDIWSPDDDPNTVFIFAVNHLPNPAHYEPHDKKAPKARSRIEVFRHKIGTTDAEHMRSVWHPLIRTPNDLYIINERSFYVTNDHFYREGAMKLFEDIAYGTLAPWTDLVHVEITDLHSKDDSAGVEATVAIKGLHNNNGLSRGRDKDEILIARASVGVLVLATPAPHPHLKVLDSIQMTCTIDNPSYFQDPYADVTGRDASGYVLAGLARAAAFPDPDGLDPVMVWLVQSKLGPEKKRPLKDQWERRLIFQDRGKVIRSAATALLVAINPEENDRKKQAWLWVTGPVALAIVVSKINL